MKYTIVALVLVLLLFGFFALQNNNSNEISSDQRAETQTVSDETEEVEGTEQPVSQTEEKNTVETETQISVSEDVIKANPSLSFRGYTPGTFSEYRSGIVSQLDDKRIVLAFFADWCPSCQIAKADIDENLARIPGDVAILEVDYDNSTQLRQRYGVTTQHTFVQVDSSGEMITSWRGANSLEDILSNI